MAAGLSGGLPLFTFKGIRVFMHWTFLLLPAWVAWRGISAEHTLAEIGVELTFVLVVFACVVLHEFGHALTALRYGVRTRNIVLLPIGGVASLERMPEEPRKEFWITLAGPLVNVAIALLVAGVMWATGAPFITEEMMEGEVSWRTLPAYIVSTNVFLFIFNMIPAFPMDGGRLLRSGLSLLMPRIKATRIAVTIGRICAVGFVAYAIYQGKPFLILLGVFVFMAAGAELRMLETRTLTQAATVAGAMTARFSAALVDAAVREGLAEMDRNGDELLVVLDQREVQGVAMRETLRNADPDAPLSGLDLLRVPAVRPTDNAATVHRYMLAQGYPVCLVIEGDRLVGVVTAGALAAWLAEREDGASGAKA